MFKLNHDDKISSWAEHRSQLETCDDPFQTVIDFWRDAPFVPYNRNIDPFDSDNWPTPWEIIVDNQYDDFTKSLMIAYSLKFTQRFSNSAIDVRIAIDKIKNIYYNIVCVDNKWAVNYNDNISILIANLPESFSIENIIEVAGSR